MHKYLRSKSTGMNPNRRTTVAQLVNLVCN